MTATPPLAIGADTYQVETFPLPAPKAGNPLPLDLALSPTALWLSTEFDCRIYALPLTAAAGTTLTAHDIPAPAAPLFRSTLFGQDNANPLAGAERIAVTMDGSVWVTQMGQGGYGGAEQNLSRLLRRRPDGRWLSYLIPWNTPEAIGLYVEPNLAMAYVALGSPVAGHAIVATQPATWLPSETSPTLDGSVIATRVGRDTRRGWRVYDLPAADAHPSHITKGPDGRLYVTAYWGNAIVALDPVTGARQRYDLPAAPAGAIFGSNGPWQMQWDMLGGLYVTGDFGRRLFRLTPQTGAVTTTELAPPLMAGEQVHSLAIQGPAVWWTAYTAQATTPGGRIGRVRQGVVEVSPPLSSVGIFGGATGIVAAPNGDLWVALFQSKAVARLRKV